MLEFREDTHEYFNDGKKLISTTQLMRKHGLAPNYDGINPEVLKNKAERGTLIHAEIEDYIKTGILGFTNEVYQFSDYHKKSGLTNVLSETKVCNDIVAGTIDLVFKQDNQKYIADIKTTYTLHKEAVSWQLSIYLYLLLRGETKEWDSWKGQAFHFNKDNLNVVDIPLKPLAEVERLLDCERKGIIYTYNLTNVNTDLENLVELSTLIETLNNQVEEAKKRQETLKTALMERMEAEGLTSYEKDRVKLTIVKSKTSSKVVKESEMNQSIVEAYTKAKADYDKEAESHTEVVKKDKKPYLKITLKGE